jgi:hypothetical protein
MASDMQNRIHLAIDLSISKRDDIRVTQRHHFTTEETKKKFRHKKRYESDPNICW